MTWGAVAAAGIGAATSIAGGRAQKKAAGKSQQYQQRETEKARGYLEPYRQFGEEELAGLRGMEPYRDPTMEEVMAGQGYATRLGAIESSAAARGGLLSGNALRDIGEFGASEFGRERGRRRENYMDEFNRRMARVNLGYGAAGGEAGITTGAIPGMVSSIGQQGQARAGIYSGAGSAIAGGIGEYQGQKQWQDYLNRAYSQG